MINQQNYRTRTDDILNQILISVEDDDFWKNHFEMIKYQHGSYGVHLAVFVEPYLTYILEGKKTIESRFSVKRTPPYNKVFKNDIILLKRSGGPILGICVADDVWNYELDVSSWKEIRKFEKALCAQDPKFWADRKHASFATLIRINKSRKIEPLKISKQDRRAWVVIQKKESQTKLI